MRLAFRITLVAQRTLGLIACGTTSADVEDQDVRAKIISVMPDDQACRTLSAYAEAINHTLSLDRLASEGAPFLNSFMGNSICGPSRASIMTGKHSHQRGVVGNASQWDNQQTSFVRSIQDAGYTTALIGKWRLNSPRKLLV